MNTLIICIFCVIFVVCIVLIVRSNIRLRRDYTSLKTMFENIHSYAFLIDGGVNVKKTNYYALNPDAKKDATMILGNVLRCKNGCDAGLCGTSPHCAECSIRDHITKAFQTKSDFSDLETHMQLYTSNHNAVDTDVIVDGKYVNVNGEPNMVIGVKDITPTKTLQKLYMDEKVRSQRDSKRYLSMINKIVNNIILPFNTLIGYISMFQNAKSQEERDNSARFINTQANFIKNWVTDFVSHDVTNQIEEEKDGEKTGLENHTEYKTVLPKLLVASSNENLYKKIKDYTIDKFSIELEQTDLDMAVYAVTLYDVYAIIVYLPVERTMDLLNTLHGLKPKLPVILVVDDEKEENLLKCKNDPFVFFMKAHFDQQELVRILGIMEI